MEKVNGVILLIYGIPAAGKTRLSTSLCKESQRHNNGTFISVHYDDFYPPDLRTDQEYSSTRDATCSGPFFKLKEIRKDINDNLEYLIRTNGLGTATGSDLPTVVSQEGWAKFLHQVSSSNSHTTFDNHGRYVSIVTYIV